MTNFDFFIKRSFDIIISFFALILFLPFIFLFWLFSTIDLRSNGFFLQKRVGKNGVIFNIIKIKTMKQIPGFTTTVTSSNDPRITRFGAFLRKYKLDELPQIWNVFVGHMSFVGPRPDVPGFADNLSDEDKIILSVRPGITGPASIFFKNEEDLLSSQSDPEKFNKEFIFPKKIYLNKKYVDEWTLLLDIKYILKTLFN